MLVDCAVFDTVLAIMHLSMEDLLVSALSGVLGGVCHIGWSDQ